MSITVNELITKLTFKQDKSGAVRYEKLLSGVGVSAAKMVNKMDKDFGRFEKNNQQISCLMTDRRSLQLNKSNLFKQTK